MALVINPDENVTISQNDYVDQHSPIELDLETRTFSSFVTNGRPYVVAIAGDRNSQKITINTPVEYDGIDLYGTTCYLAWETTWKDDEGKVSKGVIDLGTAKYLQNGEFVDWSEVTPSPTDRLQFYWWIDEKQVARPGDCLFKILFVLSEENTEDNDVEDYYYCLASKSGKFAIEDPGFSEALSDETPSLVFDTIDVNSIHKIEGWIEDFEKLLKEEGIDNLGDKFNQIDESIENLNNTVTNITSYVDNLNPRFEKVEEDVQSLNSVVSNVTNYIDNELAPGLNTIEGELININNAIDEIDQLVTESQEDIAAAQEDIATTNQEVSNLKIDVFNLNYELDKTNIENGLGLYSLQTKHPTRANLAGGNSNTVFGEWNQANGNVYHFAAGRANQIDRGLAGVAIGQYNSVRAKDSIALTEDALVKADGGVAAGRETIVDGTDSIAINSDTISQHSNQLVLGRLNAPNENAAVIVGNGSFDRQNAMTIQKDGRVTIGGKFEDSAFEKYVYHKIVGFQDYEEFSPDDFEATPIQGTNDWRYPSANTYGIQGNGSGRTMTNLSYSIKWKEKDADGNEQEKTQEYSTKCVKLQLDSTALQTYPRTVVKLKRDELFKIEKNTPYIVTAWLYSEEECDITVFLGVSSTLAYFNDSKPDHLRFPMHIEANTWQSVTLEFPSFIDDEENKYDTKNKDCYMTIGVSRRGTDRDNIKWIYLDKVTVIEAEKKETPTYKYTANEEIKAIEINNTSVTIDAKDDVDCLSFTSNNHMGTGRAQAMLLDKNHHYIKIFKDKDYRFRFKYRLIDGDASKNTKLNYWLCATQDTTGNFVNESKNDCLLYEANATNKNDKELSATEWRVEEVAFTAAASGYLRIGVTTDLITGSRTVGIADFSLVEDSFPAVYPYRAKFNNYFTNLYKIAEPTTLSSYVNQWLVGKQLQAEDLNFFGTGHGDVYRIQETDVPVIRFSDDDTVVREGLYDDQTHSIVVNDGRVVLCYVDKLIPWRIGARERGIYVDSNIWLLTYKKWVDNEPIDLTDIGGGNTEELENRIDTIEQDIDTALDAILNLQYALIGGEG